MPGKVFLNIFTKEITIMHRRKGDSRQNDVNNQVPNPLEESQIIQTVEERFQAMINNLYVKVEELQIKNKRLEEKLRKNKNQLRAFSNTRGEVQGLVATHTEDMNIQLAVLRENNEIESNNLREQLAKVENRLVDILRETQEGVRNFQNLAIDLAKRALPKDSPLILPENNYIIKYMVRNGYFTWPLFRIRMQEKLTILMGLLVDILSLPVTYGRVSTPAWNLITDIYSITSCSLEDAFSNPARANPGFFARAEGTRLPICTMPHYSLKSNCFFGSGVSAFSQGFALGSLKKKQNVFFNFARDKAGSFDNDDAKNIFYYLGCYFLCSFFLEVSICCLLDGLNGESFILNDLIISSLLSTVLLFGFQAIFAGISLGRREVKDEYAKILLGLLDNYLLLGINLIELLSSPYSAVPRLGLVACTALAGEKAVYKILGEPRAENEPAENRRRCTLL
jgi:hypothetical protein